MSSNPILRFAEAGKTYPPQRTPLRQLWSHLRGHGRDSLGGYTALQNLSFEVYPGQSLGIVGLNGAGKSTLLQLAAGTLTPSHGQVHSHGRIAALLELGSGFNPEATGRENIYLYAATMGLSREQVEQRLDSIIEFSGLRNALDMPVKTYSSGMQVRLAFSVATSVDPDILIVDEALSVGDGVFAKRSFDRVMQLREKGTALLLCSHALFHVDLFCERTLWLDQGSICAFGPTTEVVPRYQEFLDSLNQEPAPANQSEVQAEVAQGLLSAARPELVRLVRAEVSLDGTVGKELHGHSRQSHLTVDIHLQVSEQEPHPCAAIVISSESGKIIGSSFCETGVIKAHDEQGHAYARFDLPNIPLNKGRYRVGVYLLCKDMRYVYEWVDPFAYIELKAAGSAQGPWLMPGEWSRQDKDVAVAG
ncbi:ABC transporter ATP-binding protein [Comamonas sp. Y6]|uniref:ABC transporter ATP-binding protein n=1 Tax=Comamonas resistens TaxID=3046670 RepID=A0ABY8SP91_9BURK|nr:ABC transporter ATP-binding protein [Comamonas resistens]MDL5036562.1 ABC transporter ATP-binding protein [Comamonas resistens]WHS64900.1 ABC transporter ATP-binding protein [Comamonas resistens]